MSSPDFSIDGQIRYFEMAHKVMGYREPEKNSYEYHAAQTLRSLREENARLENRVRDLERRHLDASFMLADWDGHYDPETKKGNVEELAKLIEDAYTALQGRSWLLPEDEYNAYDSNPNGGA
jgi:hypothetical protein